MQSKNQATIHNTVEGVFKLSLQYQGRGISRTVRYLNQRHLQLYDALCARLVYRHLLQRLRQLRTAL